MNVCNNQLTFSIEVDVTYLCARLKWTLNIVATVPWGLIFIYPSNFVFSCVLITKIFSIQKMFKKYNTVYKCQYRKKLFLFLMYVNFFFCVCLCV